MGEKELIPAIRFKGFTDPWEQRKLGRFTQIKTGTSNLQDADPDGKYPFFVRSDQIERSSHYTYDGEAILVPGEGRLGEIFHYVNGKFDYHQRVYKISQFDGVYAKFVLYFMMKHFKKYALENTSKATVDSIRLPTLTEFSVGIPDFAEQMVIGVIFQNVDSLIALHQRKLEKLQRMKQALLEKLFPKNGAVVPELRFNGFTDAWEQRKISNYLQESKIEGGSGDVAQKLTVKLWGKGVVKKNDYGGSKSTKYFRREAGQFIYSKLDFLNGAFGVIPNELAGYESTADLPAFDVTSLNAKYLLLFVSQEKFYIKQGMIADGSRKAKRIHVGTFLTMPVLVPTLEEQNVIVATFNELESLIALHQRKLEKLQQLKSAFLTKMFV